MSCGIEWLQVRSSWNVNKGQFNSSSDELYYGKIMLF